MPRHPKRVTEALDNRHSPSTDMSYEAKRICIMNDIAMATPYKEIVNKYTASWGLSEATIYRLIEVIKADMERGTVQSEIKELNAHRTNAIIEQAMESGKLETAIKAIDTQNKTVGLYKQEKEEIEKDVSINVKFNF